MTENRYNNPFTATLNGIIDLFRKGKAFGVLAPEDRIDEKKCLITGANSGLGFAVAEELARRGGHVYMACRSGIPEAGQQIKRITGSEHVTMLKADLSDHNSIYELLEDIKQRQLQFDIVIFNAAIVPAGSEQTATGLDLMFMVNYMAKFILIRNMLAMKLLKTENSIPRLLFISSESHRTGREIDFADFGNYHAYGVGKVISRYGDYKLLLTALARYIHRTQNTDGVKIGVYALCPGPINSNIARAAPSWSKPLLKVVFKFLFSSPEKAAMPVNYLACSKDVEAKSNIYLHLMTEKLPDAQTDDPEKGQQLWEASEKLYQDLISDSQ